MLRTNFLMLLTTALLVAGLSAQMPEPASVAMSGPMLSVMPPKAGLSMQVESIDFTPVKGAPFCAVITTEHTQPFADGNRIHTTDSSTLCRDSEGRTRREAGLNLLGAAPQKSGAKLITIVDPVAGVRYVLDSSSKTARKMALPPPLRPGAAGGKFVHHAGTAIKEDRVMVMR